MLTKWYGVNQTFVWCLCCLGDKYVLAIKVLEDFNFTLSILEKLTEIIKKERDGNSTTSTDTWRSSISCKEIINTSLGK